MVWYLMVLYGVSWEIFWFDGGLFDHGTHEGFCSFDLGMYVVGVYLLATGAAKACFWLTTYAI